MRRVRIALALALAASLPGCATAPTPPAVTQVAAAIDRAEAAYLRARPIVLFLLPLLPDDREAQARDAMATIERAFAAARATRDAIEQLAWLRAASAGLTALEALQAAAPTAR